MKKIIALVLAMVLLTGCGGKQSASEDLMKNVTLPKENAFLSIGQDSPDAFDPATDTAWDNTQITDFGIRLLQASLEEGENILISPQSVLTALAMTANGARGETLSQMETVLGQSVAALNCWHKYSVMGREGLLHTANGIWIKDDPQLSVNEEFLQTNLAYFDASVYKAPFDNTTLKQINGFVEEHTDGMIKNILDKIPAVAEMYLVNALALDAQWEEVYKGNQVRRGEFTTEDGVVQSVELMYSKENLYLENDLATGFQKPYKEGKTERYAFVALLPKEGVTVAELVQSLNGESLRQMLGNPQTITVNGAIPKFEGEYEVQMENVLKSMGMTDAFDSAKADFSAMATHTDGNIFISRVIHKTYISLAEKGTKAGAATVVEAVRESAMEEESKRVTLDRPFVYMILDTQTNTPVFLGTCMEI